jgi:hypothetical protein
MLKIFPVLFGLFQETFGEYMFRFSKRHYSVVNENNNLDSDDQ